MTVDLRPAWRTYSVKGGFPRGQGVRCRNCQEVLKISQWRGFVVRLLPLLLLAPFIWYRDSSVALRALIGVAVMVSVLAPYVHLFPGLFELKKADPFDDLRDDDGAFD